MDRLVRISDAATTLGVSVTTLRRWEKSGKLRADRVQAGHRRYDLSKIKPGLCRAKDTNRRTVAYARVSSHDQSDLERQKQVLEIITVFSARLYGSRSHKNQKLLDSVIRAVEKALQC